MSRRSNQDWLDELSGKRGPDEQVLAHQDLAGYLYTVVYNYLLKRQEDMELLATFAPGELAALAEDFVQETLERLARNNHALLGQFRGAGHFTSWAAQIVRHQAGGELKKAYWRRREPVAAAGSPAAAAWSPTFEFTVASDALSPETLAIQQQAAEILQTSLTRLQDRERLALWGCIAEGRQAQFVAEALDTTANAVHLLVFRAKRKLRKYLEEAGLTPDILETFV